MKVWLVAVPFIGSIAFLALGGAYDGTMKPVRAEREFVQACTNKLFSTGVRLTEAKNTCACIADETKADLAGNAPSAMAESDLERHLAACSAKHIRSGTPHAESAGTGSTPAAGAGWGHEEPASDWGAQSR